MVPKGWEVTRLGACVDLMQSGLSRKLSNEDIGLPVIRSGNMEDVETNFDDLKYWYADDPQGADTSIYVLQDEDILVNFINSLSQIGKACIYRNKINRPCIYTTNLLRIKANGKIDNNYLFCQTKTARYDKYVQSITKPAVNQASFTTKEFKMFEFLLPPLPEQRKITQILSTWDKAITTTERLLTNRQQQKKALMQRLLTGKQRFAGFEGEWFYSELINVTEFIKDGTHGTHERLESGILLLAATNISPQGQIIFDGASNISEIEYNKIHAKYQIQKNDVLITVVGTIGRSAIVRDVPTFTLQRSVAIIRTDRSVLSSEYFYVVTHSEHFQSQLKKRANITAQPGVYLGELAKIRIPIPSLDEQQKIASVLSAADAEITTIQNQLDNLKQQKKALMQQLLTGKRRVKVDSPALAAQ